MIIRFDFSGDVPLYQQLHDQVAADILAGRLRPGDRLPTIRALAEESGVNMMTISKAYHLLKQEGYIRTDRSRGAVVAGERAEAAPPPETVAALRGCLAALRGAGLRREDVTALCARLFEEVSE